MNTKLSVYYEAKINNLMLDLTDAQKAVIKQYMIDDAGSDLIFFFEDYLSMDEEVAEEIQLMLELKAKATYLESREEKLKGIEEIICYLKNL